MSVNGAGGSLDDLPEPVRRFAKEHHSWSTAALLMKWRSCGENEETFLAEMEILENNRRRAYYRELGFTHDPKDGEPL